VGISGEASGSKVRGGGGQKKAESKNKVTVGGGGGGGGVSRDHGDCPGRDSETPPEPDTTKKIRCGEGVGLTVTLGATMREKGKVATGGGRAEKLA